ncbi:TPA: hypothetical protein N0F65_002558 [Lagenidium giganteum]|uniref:Uncharacterized protein n=1 Tax=Lagenidium giganteum TaxID=4803 RepID=A0AAV2YM77_9STRA|nr:TPA: hypothetical protein N0F65_012306 [Lagenidium giganteum]DAZ94418.1 TPA: hypothetical protein N0F65_002558 [Lagenidium giganteum]
MDDTIDALHEEFASSRKETAMPKILLCGNVNGQWPLVLERVRKLNSGKGPAFDLLVCVGRVFPLPSDAAFPVATYVVPANEDESMLNVDERQAAVYQRMAQHVASGSTAPMEIVKNCFMLGNQGVATVHGLKIAFLSGTLSGSSDDCSRSPLLHHARETVQQFWSQLADAEPKALEGVDFFFSAEYPANFQRLLGAQQVPEQVQKVDGSLAVTDAVRCIRPKYHIVSQPDDGTARGIFFQRLPYVSESESGHKHITRLIGLCGVNTLKDKSKKYLHALQVASTNGATVDDKGVELPPGTTKDPYVAAEPTQQAPTSPPNKRRRTDAAPSRLSAEQVAQLTSKANAAGNQFFYDQRLADRGQRAAQRDQERQQRSRGPPVPQRTECWFCLATPSVERHLIVSIGQEAYLAIPKGAINADHLLIVPIEHEPSMTKLSASAEKEVERFKTQLGKLFAAEGKELIVFDRNVATLGATHCHLQLVGLPTAKARMTRRVFEVEGDKYNVGFSSLSDKADLRAAVQDRSYFYAEVPHEDTAHERVRLLHMVDGKHYVQFGRHAAACALEVPRRANWKFCVVPKPEEEEMTQAFRKRWKPFDFTLEDDDE